MFPVHTLNTDIGVPDEALADGGYVEPPQWSLESTDQYPIIAAAASDKFFIEHYSHMNPSRARVMYKPDGETGTKIENFENEGGETYPYRKHFFGRGKHT
jgi:hypothetical protein